MRASLHPASALAVVTLACAPTAEAPPAHDGPAIIRAVAVLHPTTGSETRGTVVFTGTGAGIRIAAQVAGLTPGDHGFHVHELGDCTAPDGTSAGGHFNPMAMAHGGPAADQRHVGDLGNLSADEVGVASYERTDTLIAFAGMHSIIGRAVIVHASPDDLLSQPTGAAGARSACGVVVIAEVEGGT